MTLLVPEGLLLMIAPATAIRRNQQTKSGHYRLIEFGATYTAFRLFGCSEDRD